MSTITENGTGVWNVSAEEYHADTARIGHSMLKDFRSDPMLFHGRYVSGEIPRGEPSPAMKLGTALHCAILEPKTFDLRYWTPPPTASDGKPWDRRVKSHKEEWSLIESAAEGREAISLADLEQVQAMVDSIERLPAWIGLRDNDQPVEQAICWRDEKTRLLCKALRDLVVSDELIVNIKTAADPSPNGFAKAATNLGYHRSSAWYLDGNHAVFGIRGKELFIVVGNSPPFTAAAHELSDTFVEIGRQQNRRAMDNLARCKETGEWQAEWTRQVNLLYPPRFAQTEEEYET